MEDIALGLLTLLGLILNIMSIKYLKEVKTRSVIKTLTFFSMGLGFFLFVILVIAQSSHSLLALLFYPSIFFWNLGFFELFFILFVRPKKT